MNIIMFGPPGAGKGTQSDNLVKDFKLLKISTGDLLRKEIKDNTSLGIKIKAIIDQGILAPDEIINGLIEKLLSKKNYINRLIFDGYPRNLDQAKNLDYLMEKNNQKISYVLSLNVDENIITRRILGRMVCSKCGLNFNKFFNPSTNKNHQCEQKFLQVRSDDNSKTLKNRFATYKKERKPILDYYKNQNLLYEIDGMKGIPVIYKEICHIINSVEA